LIDVKFSGLGINEAAILGAASLVWKDLEKEERALKMLLEN
jgi:hypothetical protein